MPFDAHVYVERHRNIAVNGGSCAAYVLMKLRMQLYICAPSSDAKATRHLWRFFVHWTQHPPSRWTIALENINIDPTSLVADLSISYFPALSGQLLFLLFCPAAGISSGVVRFEASHTYSHNLAAIRDSRPNWKIPSLPDSANISTSAFGKCLAVQSNFIKIGGTNECHRLSFGKRTLALNATSEVSHAFDTNSAFPQNIFSPERRCND